MGQAEEKLEVGKISLQLKKNKSLLFSSEFFQNGGCKMPVKASKSSGS